MANAKRNKINVFKIIINTIKMEKLNLFPTGHNIFGLQRRFFRNYTSPMKERKNRSWSFKKARTINLMFKWQMR
jgi:hypothetical protein